MAKPDYSNMTDEELRKLGEQEGLVESQAVQTPSSDLDTLSDDELRELAKQEGLIEGTSTGESIARGAAQGLTLGFAPEITAAVESTFTDKDYDESVRESRREYELAKKDNPFTYGAADMVGGVAGALVMPGSVTAKLGGNIALGAISGVGRSDGEDVGKAALIGGALGAAGYGAGKVAGRLLSGTAKKSAKSLTKIQKAQVLEGGFGADVPSKMGQVSSTLKRYGTSIDDASELILNAKHADGTHVFRGQGVDETLSSVKTYLDVEGNKIGSIIRTLKDKNIVSKNKILNNLQKNIDEMFTGPIQNSTEKEAYLKSLKRLADSFTEDVVGYDDLFEEAAKIGNNAYRRGVQDNNINIVAEQDMSRWLRDLVRGGVKKELGEDVLEEFVKAQKNYATAAGSARVLAKDAGKELGVVGRFKNLLSIRGTMVGISSFALFGGNPVAAGLAVATANHVMQSPTIKMSAARALNKSAVGAMISRINNGSAVGKKMAERIVAASFRSDASFAAALKTEVAKSSLMDKPLSRTTTEAWNRAHEIIPIVEEYNAQLGEELNKAVSNEDKQMFGAIVHGMSSTAGAQRLIQPGLGWDGKAVTPEEKAMVEAQIESANIPYTARLKLLRQFKKDSVIPPLEQYEGRIKNGNKKDALKPRDKQGRKRELY